MTTLAPRAESWRAVARPMPLEEPVMRATLPARGVEEGIVDVVVEAVVEVEVDAGLFCLDFEDEACDFDRIEGRCMSCLVQ